MGGRIASDDGTEPGHPLLPGLRRGVVGWNPVLAMAGAYPRS